VNVSWRLSHTSFKIVGVPLFIAALSPVSARAASCSSLASLSLPDTTITSAEVEPAGSFTGLPPGAPRPAVSPFKDVPDFCRVIAVIRPVKDSEIKIEVWLPTSAWNGKLLGIGNGGWAGWIAHQSLAQSLRLGYAAAGTNTGHDGGAGDASFALGHPEKLIDFAYRSEHLMTVQAKAIIAAFYGKGPRLSYWNGCSSGGKQGLMEAQRYPDDYNGIIEGDPAAFWTHLMFETVWPVEVSLKDPASYIPPSKYPLIHKAALDACDMLDGVRDGLIEDPTRCHFDPKVLECAGPDGPSCLTAAQVESARELYAGPKNPRTGKQIFPGEEPGSELTWGALAKGPEPMVIPVSYFKYVLFKNPDWKWQTLNFDSDVALADKLDGKILNAIDPNLRAFKAHGGKLLMYHGWNDPLIFPGVSVNYYQNVVKTMGGAAKTEDFARLFMIPGMEHCDGGPGTDIFDKVGTLEQWVEKGAAPDKIIASHKTNGVLDMTRPLCPYPQVARWTGSGSTNDAANFRCVDPRDEILSEVSK
jgi:feruloyl esterase